MQNEALDRTEKLAQEFKSFLTSNPRVTSLNLVNAWDAYIQYKYSIAPIGELDELKKCLTVRACMPTHLAIHASEELRKDIETSLFDEEPNGVVSHFVDAMEFVAINPWQLDNPIFNK